MKRFLWKGSCVLLVVTGAGAAAAALLREDDRVEDLMEHIHEGRRSPYRQLEFQAAADQPAWGVVAATLPPFEAMARALVTSSDAEIRDSADGYVDAVKGLMAATKTRDPKGLQEAFATLEQSCGDCHFEGGVGGELEDEGHEEELERGRRENEERKAARD